MLDSFGEINVAVEQTLSIINYQLFWG